MPTYDNVINLTAGNDYKKITAAGSYLIYGLDGNDTITISVSRFSGAPDAPDYLDGGNGNDLLTAAGTNDILVGGAGDDILKGNDGADSLDGGEGGDILDGGNGNDTLDGGSGDDNLLAGYGDDLAFGGDGNDTLLGSRGADTLYGGAGNDLLDGGTEAGLLDGGDGDDTLLGSTGNDTLIGGLGADQLIASSGNDLISGGGGDDEVYAGDGSDTIDGEEGNDRVFAGAGNDLVEGGLGDDSIDGSDGIDTLNGGSGADTLTGGAGNDLLNGGADNDVLIGSTGADTMDGGDGSDTADYSTSTGPVGIDLLQGVFSGGATGDVLTGIETLVGSAFNDILIGDAVNNRLVGGNGDDQFDGRDGNDTLVGGLGADTILGGNGTDTADYSASAAAVVVTVSGQGTTGGNTGGDAEGDRLGGIETLIGSAFADQLFGDSADTVNNLFVGGDGNDTLFGGGGNDTLIGGLGADSFNGGNGLDTADYSAATGAIYALASGIGQVTIQGPAAEAQGDVLALIENLIGSAFADSLVGASNDTTANRFEGRAGADTLNGGGGNDTLIGGLGADTLIGGTGIDTADYSESSQGVVVQVRLVTTQAFLGDAQGDILNGVENLVGSAFADQLLGDSADTVANLFVGGAGNDSLNAGGGNDTLAGGLGADTLIGGTGIDTADYSTSAQGVAVQVRLVTTQAFLGDAQGDILNGVENLVGSASADQLFGDAADTVGNRFVGGDGNDTLFGGGGNDTLIGGPGADSLVGGAGVDRFEFQSAGDGADRIDDFAPGVDKLALLFAVGAEVVIDADPLASGSAAAVLYETDTGILSFDADGNGANAAVTLATLVGVPALTAGDVVFT